MAWLWIRTANYQTAVQRKTTTVLHKAGKCPIFVYVKFRPDERIGWYINFTTKKEDQIWGSRYNSTYNDIMELSTHNKFQNNVDPPFTSHHLVVRKKRGGDPNGLWTVDLDVHISIAGNVIAKNYLNIWSLGFTSYSRTTLGCCINFIVQISLLICHIV